MATKTYTANYPGGYPSGGIKLKLLVTTVETNIAENWTKERCDLYMQVDNASGGYWNNYSQSVGININGNEINGVCTFDARSTGDKSLLLNQIIQVYHDSDGNKSFTVTAHHDSGTALGNASLIGAFYCDKIPRYLNITNHSLKNKGLSTISINWATDVPRDWTQYSINGEAWVDAGDTVAADGKSGYYTINGLNPNTAYNIRTRLKRADSQLYTESGTINVSTYDICRITSPAITVANSDTAFTMQASNPSGTLVRVDMYIELMNSDRSARIGNQIRYNNVNPKTFPVSDMLILASYIPNSNSANFRIGVITHVSDGEEYTDRRDGVFSIVNANPIFSNFTYQDTNATTIALTGNNQNLIKGYSNVKTIISTSNKATAQKSASIVKYRTDIASKNNEVSYSSTSQVEMNISAVDSNVIYLKAIDSRGNYTTISKNANIVEYSNSVIKSMKFERQNGIGTTVDVKGNGTYSNVNFGAITNAITSIKYRIKEYGSSTWGSLVDITSLFDISSGNFVNKSTGNTIAGFPLGTAFDIEVQITDRLTTLVYRFILTSGKPCMDLIKEKQILGLGKVADNTLPEGSLDSAGAGSFPLGILTKTLPNGDTTTFAYWHGIPNGVYWCGNNANVLNKPTSYGIVYVSRSGGYAGACDFSVLWFSQSSGKIYRISGNSTAISGWRSLIYDDELLNKTYPVRGNLSIKCFNKSCNIIWWNLGTINR